MKESKQEVESKAWIMVCGLSSLLISTLSITALLCSNSQLAFRLEKNPLEVQIIEISQSETEDPEKHYRLGEALRLLRDEGVLIVGASMAVKVSRTYFLL